MRYSIVLASFVLEILWPHLARAQGLRFSQAELSRQPEEGTASNRKRFGGSDFKDRFTWAETDRLPKKVGHQRGTNACVSHCLANLFYFEHPHPPGSKESFNPYYNYFWAKKLEHNWKTPESSRWDDNGIMFYHGFRALNTQGLCLSDEYEFTDHGHSIYLKPVPPPAEVASSANRRIVHFAAKKLKTTKAGKLKETIKSEISNGHVLPAGFLIHRNFSKNQGLITLPDGRMVWKQKQKERIPHAMLIVGFDDNISAFHVLNSHGPDFGNDGYLWIDYDFLADQGKDRAAPDDNPCCVVVYSYSAVLEKNLNPWEKENKERSVWTKLIDSNGVKNYQKAKAVTPEERNEAIKVDDLVKLDRRYTRAIHARPWVLNRKEKGLSTSEILYKIRSGEVFRVLRILEVNDEVWMEVKKIP